MTANNIFARRDQIAGLAWGVHSPFRQYMQRIADGQMAAHGGAELLESGETFFPLDAESTTSSELRFLGTLEFRGHNGMMAVTVQQPRLERSIDHCQLTITDPFEPGARMSLVEIEFHDAVPGTTRLTESGADVFMGNYGEQTFFDPVRIVWAEKGEQE